MPMMLAPCASIISIIGGMFLYECAWGLGPPPHSVRTGGLRVLGLLRDFVPVRFRFLGFKLCQSRFYRGLGSRIRNCLVSFGLLKVFLGLGSIWG